MAPRCAALAPAWLLLAAASAGQATVAAAASTPGATVAGTATIPRAGFVPPSWTSDWMDLPTTTVTVSSTTTSSRTSTTYTGSTSTRTTTTVYCFEEQVVWEPLDMPGTTFTTQRDAEACRQVCEDTEGCYHFSYWQLEGNCHLQDALALRREGRAAYLSGPFACLGSSGDLRDKFVLAAPQQYLPQELRCMDVGVAWEPVLERHPSGESPGTQLELIKSCQARCAGKEECEHFTISVTTGICRLSGAAAARLTGIFHTISGPPGCSEDEDGEYEEDPIFLRKFFAGRWSLPSMAHWQVAAAASLTSSLAGALACIAVARFRQRNERPGSMMDLRRMQLVIAVPEELEAPGSVE